MKLHYVLLVLSMMILASCSALVNNDAPSERQNTLPTTTAPVAAQPEIIESPIGPDGFPLPPEETDAVREIPFAAFKYGFEPSTIEVTRGEKVRLQFTTRDVAHGFAVPDLGIASVKVEPGQTVPVDFTADKAGTFEVKCSVFCGSGHKEMKAQIVVN